jgi:hypothetical protein
VTAEGIAKSDRSGVIPVTWLYLAVAVTAFWAPEPRDDERKAEQTKPAPHAQVQESSPPAAPAKKTAGANSAKTKQSASKSTKASASQDRAGKKSTAASTSSTGKKKTSTAATGGQTKPKDAAHAAGKTSAGGEVRVLTAAEMRKRRSPFLLPPAASPDDRYGGEEIDWALLPPWRQTSFFGIRARGQFFIYVVDRSRSMIDNDRFARATIELRKSVFSLQQPQKFEVIFYNTESIPMPGGPIPRSADLEAKNQLLLWIRLMEPDGGTDPRVALKQALSLRPDAVFLLSDGDLPEGSVREIDKLNTAKIPIHCVDLAGGLAGDDLKRIADHNGGEYASRPGDLQGRP